MCEYACQGIVYVVRHPVADIRQVSFIDHANDLLDKSLFYYYHLTEQAHFLDVRDLHIGVRVGGHSFRNDERTWVSQAKRKK